MALVMRMKALLTEMKNSLIHWNPISRTAVRVGLAVCMAAFSACVLLYLAAGSYPAEYYTLMRWCRELAICARDSLTAVVAAALIGEIIVRAGLPHSNDTINK